MHEYIKDTEDLVTIQLDQHRNQLITIDLILTSFTTALAMMTVGKGAAECGGGVIDTVQHPNR